MVRWSASASRDLQGIFDYIARDSKVYARQVVENLLGKASEIEPFTQRGRVVPELGDERVRELIVYSYRLMYELHGEDVVVLAVIHGRRELPGIPRAGG